LTSVEGFSAAAPGAGTWAGFAMPPLVEGRDYYVEGGLYVFTEHYLRARGYCCDSGCRHCPYGSREAPPPPEAPDLPSDAP
jgi:Family of unknown function (DUF5522)